MSSLPPVSNAAKKPLYLTKTQKRVSSQNSKAANKKTSKSTSNTSKVFIGHGNVLKNDVVASTLVNMDLVQCKDTLNEYMKQFGELQNERDDLRRQLIAQQEDAIIVTSHMDEQYKQLQVEYNAMQERYTTLRKEYATSAEPSVIELKYHTLLDERDARIKELNAIITTLKEEVDLSSRYMQQRMEYIHELRQIQNELENKKEEHEDELNALRFQTLDRKVKLLAMEKVMKEEFDAKVSQAAEQLLESKYSALIKERNELQEELASSQLQLHCSAQEVEKLTRDKITLERHNELNQAVYTGVLQQSYSSKQETNSKEERIKQLEIRVRELVTEREALLHSSWVTAHENKIHELEKDNTSQLHTIMQLRTELGKMRQLSRTIIEQRSALENFFNTALADCRRYKKAMHMTTHTENKNYTDSFISTDTCTSGDKKRKKNKSKEFAHTLPLPECKLALQNKQYNSCNSINSKKEIWKEEEWNAKTSIEKVSGFLQEKKLNSDHSISSKDNNNTSKPTSTSDEVFKNGALYFDDLSWEDKEKIIKALFVFLNNTHISSSDRPHKPSNYISDARAETIDWRTATRDVKETTTSGNM